MNGAEASATAEKALALAYRYVSARERSTAELRAHLSTKVDDEPAVEAAVARLTDDGYVDDARYARVFIEDRRALDGWGSERIKLRLRERGIDPELIDGALGDPTAEAERGRGRALLRARFPRGFAEPRDRERAFGMLVRKGYEPELAYELLAQHARADV